MIWTSQSLIITHDNLKFFNTELGNVMSTSDAQHSADLNAQTVSAIAHLARLSLDETQSAEYAQSLNKILGMMETLKGINTDGVEPLKSPFDNPQPLREDVVTEENHREEYQAIAPQVQDGLYLVPRVIE
jgi:aspartyl-tRNA(Asn)/glutamyl-tRNA(Gln) amidotransferase subunit C